MPTFWVIPNFRWQIGSKRGQRPISNPSSVKRPFEMMRDRGLHSTGSLFNKTSLEDGDYLLCQVILHCEERGQRVHLRLGQTAPRREMAARKAPRSIHLCWRDALV